MAPQQISATADALAEEHVLVQAWKKAHNYIRRHNWYSDVLELDITSADLENEINAISAEIQNSEELQSDPLRLVLAPKGQEWDVTDGQWLPVDGPRSVENRLRPLAHLSVRDQIVSTAFMILLADAIESRQGDPRVSVSEARSRGIVSYGHRLFCDADNGGLTFRWGNSVVYRQYFQDYEAFVSRPQEVVSTSFQDSKAWAIVYADLSQFYDRVRPTLLHKKVESLLGEAADPPLLRRFRNFFRWEWHPSDRDDAEKYGKNTSPPIETFSEIALPQGMVASGFFSNAVLVDFDESVWSGVNKWHHERSWQLVDYCRYVDDIRIVVGLGPDLQNATEIEIAQKVCGHLVTLLDRDAPGLLLNPSKSQVILGRDAAAGSIPVSHTIQRINRNTSGTIDLFLGEESIDLIEGLFFSRQEDPLDFEDKFKDTFFAAKPDVRDDTVARFAANRFRRTYRSLRPLCDDDTDSNRSGSLLPALSRTSLDNKAAYFCRRLIERWVRDPSNMRLLRVAMDVYPSDKNLDVVLNLLRQYIGKGKRRKAPRRVAWYCAAELLKAGATETGLVPESDCLPEGIDLGSYQQKLVEFAKEIVEQRNTYPWFLEQQAYLLLACTKNFADRRIHRTTTPYLKNYLRLHHMLSGKVKTLRRDDTVPFVLIQRHLESDSAGAATFLACMRAVGTPTQRKWLSRVLQEDEDLAKAIRSQMTSEEVDAWNHLYSAHGAINDGSFPKKLDELPTSEAVYSLLAVARSTTNPFQQEYAALHFARALLASLSEEHDVVFPVCLKIGARNWRALWRDSFPIEQDSISVIIESATEVDGRFVLPEWITDADKWKYQLGQILRVLLTGNPDFTISARRPQPTRSLTLYAPYFSSWLRRRYGLFNGRSAFGPSWLPISSWLGSLLCRLLEWPGFARFNFDFALAEDFSKHELLELIDGRLSELERRYGRASCTPVLPLRTAKKFLRHDQPDEAGLYKMRVGVVQTVLPRKHMFTGDPCLNRPDSRFQHRRHLSAVLGGVHRMLQVRETHCDGGSGVELLVFPELAIHVDDIRSHLVPLAMQHRCMVFAGLVFHPRMPESAELVNTAYWVVPAQTPRGGINVEFVEQGKWNLTAEEETLGITPFRPAQWTLDFVDPQTHQRLWSMSGAVCYDSTDLCLAADLRHQTDMFVIPAFNTDVGTFDNMASALHYHMFQHLIVANSGEFGGSTGQAPFLDRNRRTIFHTHGNEQACIAFFEVDMNTYRNGSPPLKTPPAGYRGRS